MLVVVCLPYVTAWHPLINDVLYYDVTKTAQGLTWQYLLNSPVGYDAVKTVSYCALAVFGLGAIWLTRERDHARYTALTLILFILCSKVVLEQYLTWPMPWLAILTVAAVGRARIAAGALFTVLTAIGLVDNESWYPFGRSSWPLVVVLTVSCVGYLVVESRRGSEVRGASAARTA